MVVIRNITAIMKSIVVILAFCSLFACSSQDRGALQSAPLPGDHAAAKDRRAAVPTRGNDAVPVQTDRVSETEVPIQDSRAKEKVILNRYEDPNYAFSTIYPDGYSYEVADTSVVFRSKERSMVFSAEVIYTFRNNGLFSDVESLKEDYINQLEDFSPEVISSDYRDVDGKQVLVFSIEYLIEGAGMYVNTFAIGSDDDYFYVLQFLTPAQEYDTENILIDVIIREFEYGG